MLNILNSSDFNLRWEEILQIEKFLYFLITSNDLSLRKIVFLFKSSEINMKILSDTKEGVLVISLCVKKEEEALSTVADKV